MRIDFDVSQMDAKEAKEALLKLELRKTQLELASKARDSFLTFVSTVWPGFVAVSYTHLTLPTMLWV